MPTASLLIVGSEMLDPERRDANGPYARQALAELGLPLDSVVRVSDRIEAIAAAVAGALRTSQCVITSGGIGPTGDDLTREGVAAVFGRGLHEDAAWLAHLEERYRARGRTLNAPGRRQALVIDGAETLPNPPGLACGSWVEADGRVVALLPGVPPEFRAMLDTFVVPRLAALHPVRPAVRVVRAVAAGLPESEAEPVLLPWYHEPGVDVSILPVMGVLRITLTLTAPPATGLDVLEARARAALTDGLGPHLVSLDGTSLEESLGQRLLARGWTLAGAESCTGGAAARRVVGVPGASRWFRGAIEAYANDVKTTLLGVPREILDAHGAVSEQTARAMAEGARRALGADCAFATTGVAGPDGGTPDKPVGLVWMAAATPETTVARNIRFALDRLSIMELAANWALYTLWRLL